MNRTWLRGAAFSTFVVLVAGGASCASLPDIQAGTCGNGVVEPDHGEDCDNTSLNDAGKAACYPPGSAAACHFDCSGTDCPAGFQCGVDFVCRQPSGRFVETGHPVQIEADRLFSGDFDGDGLGDVVTQTDVQMVTLFGDTNAELGAPFVIRSETNPGLDSHPIPLNPAVGQLALDPKQADSQSTYDLVFAKSDGVTSWQGQSDRTLAPTGFSSIAFGSLQALDFTARTTSFIDDVLLAAEIDGVGIGGASIAAITGVPQGQLGTDTFIYAGFENHNAGDFARTPAVGDLDKQASSPCEEVVVAFVGEPAVHMVRTCVAPGVANAIKVSDRKNPPTGYKAPIDISLGTSKVHAGGFGARITDVDGDGNEDVLVDVDEVTNLERTWVAYGKGDGTFASVQGGAVDDAAGPLVPVPPVKVASVVLTAGQFTAATDPYPDFVLPDRIAIVGPTQDGDGGITPVEADVFADQTWTEAQMVDVDHDSVLDVVAGGSGRLDVYKGTSTPLFTHVPFTVDGDVHDIQVADFDGDRVPDIVFAADHPSDARTSIYVAWGRLFGVPQDPVLVGTFPRVVSIVNGVIGGAQGNGDAVSDLGVLTRTDGSPPTFAVSILAGSPARQLQAPFYIQQGTGGDNNGRRATIPFGFAIGNFGADPHPDLATILAVFRDPTGASATTDVEIAFSQGLQAGLLDTPQFTPVPLDTFNALGLDATVDARLPFADWSRTSMVAVNLDDPAKDSVDELVGVAPAIVAAGSFFYARLEGDTWKIEETVPTGARPTTARNPIAQVIAADLNGDGAKDVVMVTDTGDGSSVKAFMNHKNGKLATGATQISLPAYASGATETPFHVVSIAAFDSDPAPGQEIAMLTDRGGLFVAKSNDDGSVFTVTGPLCADGSDPTTCVNSPRKRIAYVPTGANDAAAAVALVALDVDGDHIDDLVIEQNGALHVFKGQAVHP